MKTMLWIIWISLTIALLGNTYHQFKVISQLKAERSIWQQQRYELTFGLDELRQKFLSFEQLLEKAGVKSLYDKVLEKEQGNEQLKDTIHSQLQFDFRTLNLISDDHFISVVKAVLANFRIRLAYNFSDLKALLVKRAPDDSPAIFKNIPSIWPTIGTISSLFGMRFHPILKRMKFHSGVDIANMKSTDIIATADGVVAYSGPKGGYGNAIVIDHGNGFKTLYGHAQSLLVQTGAMVKRGMVIAKMGSTGRSTGPHLHYEITFADEALDPVQYVK